MIKFDDGDDDDDADDYMIDHEDANPGGETLTSCVIKVSFS